MLTYIEIRHQTDMNRTRKKRSPPKQPARSAVVVRRLRMVLTKKRLLQLPSVARLRPRRLSLRMARPINLQRRRLAPASQPPRPWSMLMTMQRRRTSNLLPRREEAERLLLPLRTARPARSLHQRRVVARRRLPPKRTRGRAAR